MLHNIDTTVTDSSKHIRKKFCYSAIDFIQCILTLEYIQNLTSYRYNVDPHTLTVILWNDFILNVSSMIMEHVMGLM